MGIRLNGSDLVDKTVCPFPSEDCFNRCCDNCCNINISSLVLTANDDVDEKPDISWSLWISSNNHVELQHLNGSFRSLIDHLNSRWSSFVTHTYVTRQQRDYVKTIKLTSSFTTFAVVQVDFAENFSFVIQKEVQAAYWSQKQATIYTVVITIGGNHHSMVIISNCMVHDTSFVYCTQKLIVAFIRDEYPTVNKINYVRYASISFRPYFLTCFYFLCSDGAPSQYKNNKNIMNLSFHQQDFGIKAAWTFTSSGHGKSPCDGLGAATKSPARKYSLRQGPEKAFCSAKDFFKFTLENTSRTLSSTKYIRQSKAFNSTIDTDNNDSSDEEISTVTSRHTRSIEVKWLDEEEVEETFQTVLKPRWNQLSTRGNNFILLEIFYIFYLMQIVLWVFGASMSLTPRLLAPSSAVPFLTQATRSPFTSS